MRRRPILVVVVSALACVGALSLRAAEKTTRKLSSAEREARSFLETMTGLLQPLNTVANQAAWIAATDVSPADRFRWRRFQSAADESSAASASGAVSPPTVTSLAASDVAMGTSLAASDVEAGPAAS